MSRGPIVGAGVAAFLIFAVIYLAVSAATGGIEGRHWAVGIVGGLVLGVVAALVAVLIARRRAG